MTARAVATSIVLACLLAACSDGHQDLAAWMEQQRRAAPVAVEPIQPPKDFPPFRFQDAGAADPFAVSNLSLQAPGKRNDRLRPDANRPKDVLENFPLESIRMVGRIRGRSGDFALLQVGPTVYRARVGDHAGQDHGRIVRITDREVVLREVVQDAAGDWVPRETVLEMQEGGKK